MQRLVLPSVEGVLQVGAHIVRPVEAVAELVTVQLSERDELSPPVPTVRQDALFGVSLDSHAASVLSHQVDSTLLHFTDNLVNVVLIKLLVSHEGLEVFDLARRFPLFSSHGTDEVVVIAQSLLVVLVTPLSEGHSLSPGQHMLKGPLEEVLLPPVLEHLVLVLLPAVLEIRTIMEANSFNNLLYAERLLILFDEGLRSHVRLDILESVLENLCSHEFLESMLTIV